MQRIKDILIGVSIATIIGLGLWLNWRVSNVEKVNAQIVQFLQQPKQAAPEQVK